MRVVRGKRVDKVDAKAVMAWAAGYPTVAVDLGTGDGRFVRDMARRNPEVGIIGVDLCEANLRDASRNAPTNALYVIADALALPDGLSGLAGYVTVNFPWGSLLRGLLDGDAALLTGLWSVMRVAATLDVRLNAGALREVGWTIKTGVDRVSAALERDGFAIVVVRELPTGRLREVPTSWAKRLAFGRERVLSSCCSSSPAWSGRQEPLRRTTRFS
jgi:16S rRNA (adenine(1408)-N(1))-methyltransferase